MNTDNDDSDIELVPIPMDRETRERLVWLSRLVGDKPLRVAGSLLRDLLREDELFNEQPRGSLN